MRDGGLKVLGALAGVIVFAGFLLAFALVNGGYVYRVECPRAGGSTETEWTYRWQSFIPYVGYDRSGCETHSGTRVALDAVGLWKIDDASEASESVDRSSEYSPDLVARLVDGCVEGGESRAFCECAIDETTIRLTPAEFEQVALAMQAGAERFDELPSELGDKARDAAIAAESDCRD